MNIKIIASGVIAIVSGCVYLYPPLNDRIIKISNEYNGVETAITSKTRRNHRIVGTILIAVGIITLLVGIIIK